MISRVAERFRRPVDTSVSRATSRSSAGIGPSPASEDDWQSPPSAHSNRAEPHRGLDDLPVYLAPEDEIRSEHTYTLRQKDQPWLILKLKSSAGAATSHPLYFDGSTIEGSVQMILSTTQAIQSVTVVLEGNTRTAGAESKSFLNLSTVLWPGETAGGHSAQKLRAGIHDWPFMLQLPATITSLIDGEHVTTPLPPTYSVKSFPAFLEYHLQVIVHRGPLRLNNHLATSVVYLPRSRPNPPSLLRQTAYANRTPALGPEVDVDGWHSITNKIRGVFFTKLDVEVDCTFSLATPLCYARGSAIPFMVTFESRNTQALDLFALPSSISVKLEQTINVGTQASNPSRESTSTNPSRKSEAPATGPRVQTNSFRQTVGTGRCLPSTDQTSPEWRRLEGEITLARDFKPSFFFVRFALQYSVILTVDAIGFSPADKSSHALTLAVDVAIATDLPRGPRQRSTGLSGAEPIQRNSNPDAINGLLLQGNQRYLHHHGAALG